MEDAEIDRLAKDVVLTLCSELVVKAGSDLREAAAAASSEALFWFLLWLAWLAWWRAVRSCERERSSSVERHLNVPSVSPCLASRPHSASSLGQL